jgi:ribonuclease J
MRVCIHRGTHEIGGTCIEIEAQHKRIVLDIGLPLESEFSDTPLPPVSGFKEDDSSLLGVFISHPHLDHYGLAPKLTQKTPLLIGSAALRILKAASQFIPGEADFNNTIEINDRTAVALGPFTLTPYLVDHSAYDAYGLLVEADGQRLYYSGDFRGHGRKGKLLDSFVSHPPKDIDVLLMEGSTFGRSGIDDKYPSESEIEDEFFEMFRSIKGMPLIWCSGQNIDRLVTIYRACRHSGRQFIADMYTACVLQSIENPRLPQPGWKGFRVYLPWFQKQTIIRKELFDLAKSFAPWRIYPEQIKEEANKSVMLFRPSMRTDLEKADCLEDATLIYSMWSGYLDRDQYRPLSDWLDEKSIPLVHCHTSGHAPISDLKRLANALAPKMLVPIHSFEPAQFPDHFENVVLKDDGHWWEPTTVFPVANLDSREETMNDDINSLIRELNEEINSHTGGGGKWPSSFDYIIEPNRLTLQTNRKIDKSGYRCLDSWGIALFHYLKTEHKLDVKKIQLVVNNNGGMWSPNDEAFKRRVSYLQINNDDIHFKIVHNNHPVNLYSQKELFERPKAETIRDFLNSRGDDDKGHLLEKSFQAFLFGKGLETETRTNDRLAILGEDFFQLKKKQYGVLREFPTGAFLNNISRRDQLTPTEFVDIVTLNRYGYLSVIELKLDDPKLEVMSQILDYALYFACYGDKILDVLSKNPDLNMKPLKDKIMCYVVNNRFHIRCDDIFQYYSTKDKSYKFQILKVVLGATKE